MKTQRVAGPFVVANDELSRLSRSMGFLTAERVMMAALEVASAGDSRTGILRKKLVYATPGLAGDTHWVRSETVDARANYAVVRSILEADRTGVEERVPVITGELIFGEANPWNILPGTKPWINSETPPGFPVSGREAILIGFTGTRRPEAVLYDYIDIAAGISGMVFLCKLGIELVMGPGNQPVGELNFVTKAADVHFHPPRFQIADCVVIPMRQRVGRTSLEVAINVVARGVAGEAAIIASACLTMCCIDHSQCPTPIPR